MADILTPHCPLCHQLPMMMFGGGSQAFCGNDDCRILMWTPTKSLDDNLLDAGVVQLPPMTDDEGKTDG